MKTTACLLLALLFAGPAYADDPKPGAKKSAFPKISCGSGAPRKLNFDSSGVNM